MRKEAPTFFHQDFCRGGSLIQTSIPNNSGSPLRPGMFSVAPTASGVPVLSPRCRMLHPRALPEGRGPPELGGQRCRPTFSHVALQKMWFWGSGSLLGFKDGQRRPYRRPRPSAGGGGRAASAVSPAPPRPPAPLQGPGGGLPQHTLIPLSPGT